MRIVLFFWIALIALSCGNFSGSDTGEVKVKEKATEKEDVVKKMTIDPLEAPGRVAIASFSHDDKKLFYYNVDEKKGAISIDGIRYILTEYEHEINGPYYRISDGKDVVITVEDTKYHEVENPEPGILNGRAGKVVIKRGQDSLVLENVSVIDGTNAD